MQSNPANLWNPRKNLPVKSSVSKRTSEQHQMNQRRSTRAKSEVAANMVLENAPNVAHSPSSNNNRNGKVDTVESNDDDDEEVLVTNVIIRRPGVDPKKIKEVTKPVATEDKGKVVETKVTKPVATEDKGKVVETKVTKPVATEDKGKVVETKVTKPVATEDKGKVVETKVTKPVATEDKGKVVEPKVTKPVATEDKGKVVETKEDEEIQWLKVIINRHRNNGGNMNRESTASFETEQTVQHTTMVSLSNVANDEEASFETEKTVQHTTMVSLSNVANDEEASFETEQTVQHTTMVSLSNVANDEELWKTLDEHLIASNKNETTVDSGISHGKAQLLDQPSYKEKILELCSLCDQSNVDVIVGELLHLLPSTSGDVRFLMVHEACVLSETFSVDPKWYLITILDLLRKADDLFNEVVWNPVSKILSSHPDLQVLGVQLALDFLMQGNCEKILYQICLSIVGEYGSILDCIGPIVEVLTIKKPEHMEITGLILAACSKLKYTFPTMTQSIEKFVSDGCQNPTVELWVTTVDLLNFSKVAPFDELVLTLRELPPFAPRKASISEKLDSLRPFLSGMEHEG